MTRASISPDARLRWRRTVPAPTAVTSHPEQGWSLLCNGIILFDDGGVLLPGGAAIAPLTCATVVLATA